MRTAPAIVSIVVAVPAVSYARPIYGDDHLARSGFTAGVSPFRGSEHVRRAAL
jgi:hypothetical protein